MDILIAVAVYLAIGLVIALFTPRCDRRVELSGADAVVLFVLFLLIWPAMLLLYFVTWAARRDERFEDGAEHANLYPDGD